MDKILIVESADAQREIYRQHFELLGFEVMEAANGIDAINLAYNQDAQVGAIVVDSDLSQRTGHYLSPPSGSPSYMSSRQLTQSLKGNHWTRDIPVIGIARQARNGWDVNAVIPKPVDLAQLTDAVDEAMDNDVRKKSTPLRLRHEEE